MSVVANHRLPGCSPAVLSHRWARHRIPAFTTSAPHAHTHHHTVEWGIHFRRPVQQRVLCQLRAAGGAGAPRSVARRQHIAMALVWCVGCIPSQYVIPSDCSDLWMRFTRFAVV